jgi:hypothetical protein
MDIPFHFPYEKSATVLFIVHVMSFWDYYCLLFPTVNYKFLKISDNESFVLKNGLHSAIVNNILLSIFKQYIHKFNNEVQTKT